MNLTFHTIFNLISIPDKPKTPPPFIDLSDEEDTNKDTQTSLFINKYSYESTGICSVCEKKGFIEEIQKHIAEKHENQPILLWRKVLEKSSKEINLDKYHLHGYGFFRYNTEIKGFQRVVFPKLLKCEHCHETFCEFDVLKLHSEEKHNVKLKTYSIFSLLDFICNQLRKCICNYCGFQERKEYLEIHHEKVHAPLLFSISYLNLNFIVEFYQIHIHHHNDDSANLSLS